LESSDKPPFRYAGHDAPTVLNPVFIGAATRALALRFDTVLAATADYIAGGNDPLKLSALELKRLNLLPPDWQIATAPNSVSSWSIGVWTGGRIGIVCMANY